jgi:hypothetical protein
VGDDFCRPGLCVPFGSFGSMTARYLSRRRGSRTGASRECDGIGSQPEAFACRLCELLEAG